VPGEQPHQAADQHREVQHRVVPVERLHQERIRQEYLLQRVLAGQADVLLGVPDPGRPVQRAGQRHPGLAPGVRPKREQAEQHARLAGEDSDHGEPRRTRAPLGKRRRGRHRQHQRSGNRSLQPGELDAQHDRPPRRVRNRNVIRPKC
jgi:hypothetical protein